MAGIYIHIPFCKKACHYCDFHFSSYLKLKEPLIEALVKEIAWQKSFLDEPVETIYFGGGTPSLLALPELDRILSSVHSHYCVSVDAEITLEANPDDLNAEKLTGLRSLNINRLSIGMQSFHDPLLKFMNRIHSSRESAEAFYHARKAGFDNINCDLIYGIPGENEEMLAHDLHTLVSLRPEHISAYCLTIEEKTVFGVWRKRNRLQEMDEEHASGHFDMVRDYLSSHDYMGYEISNFCLPGFFSRHNTGYWQDKKFLGVGPGAHSYNGDNRFFNIANNSLYIKSLDSSRIPSTIVKLSPAEKVNEYILTSLRTVWGCDLHYLKEKHKVDLISRSGQAVAAMIRQGLIEAREDKLYLTYQGRALADFVSSKLFI